MPKLRGNVRRVNLATKLDKDGDPYHVFALTIEACGDAAKDLYDQMSDLAGKDVIADVSREQLTADLVE